MSCIALEIDLCVPSIHAYSSKVQQILKSTERPRREPGTLMNPSPDPSGMRDPESRMTLWCRQARHDEARLDE